MKLDVCKLCNQKKELRKSHVVPRAVFKKALQGYNHSLSLDKKYNKVIKSQDQWAKYLLCADCEHKINYNYENYALRALRDDYKGVKHQKKGEYLQIVNVNQNKLIGYVISILWRAVESDHSVFTNTHVLRIAPLIKELFRKSIIAGEVPSNKFYSVRISKLIIQEELRGGESDFISNFSCKVNEKKEIIFLIIFEGYSFEVFLHPTPEIKLNGLGVLKKNKRILKLPYIDCFSIPELRQSLLQMIEAKNS